MRHLSVSRGRSRPTTRCSRRRKRRAAAHAQAVKRRAARRQPKGSRRAPGIFEKLLQRDALLIDRELFPTPSYFGESNFLAVGTICTVKQHQRYCKRQTQAGRSHKTREGTNLK